MTGADNQEENQADPEACRADLLRDQESTRDLARLMAENFNDILTPIIMRTEMSLAGLSPADPLHRNLSEILRAARRARDLVQQLAQQDQNNPAKPDE